MILKLDISKVKYPKNKNRKGIKIPKFLTPELAELDGIIRSDGSIFYGKDHHNDVIIYGHSSEDLLFMKYQVAPLLLKVHGKIPIKFHKYPSAGNCLRLEIHSKAIASFWNKTMNVPNNKIDFNLSPKIIKKRELVIPNLRGYFDGDGTINFSPGTRRFTSNPIKINYYPLIDYSTESKIVANQIKRSLINLKFRPFILKHIEEKGGRIGYTIRIGGRADYERFVELIGSNNPVHLTKILIYEIFGYSPPKTTMEDRIKILKKEKSPDEFYKERPVKIRPMIMKENEEKVLKALLKGPLYLKEIGEKTELKELYAVLNRLIKFGQIRFLGLRKEKFYKKRFYEITELGRKRLNRISELIEKLKHQFNLDI
jgi:hypothetical protein